MMRSKADVHKWRHLHSDNPKDAKAYNDYSYYG